MSERRSIFDDRRAICLYAICGAIFFCIAKVSYMLLKHYATFFIFHFPPRMDISIEVLGQPMIVSACILPVSTRHAYMSLDSQYFGYSVILYLGFALNAWLYTQYDLFDVYFSFLPDFMRFLAHFTAVFITDAFDWSSRPLSLVGARFSLSSISRKMANIWAMFTPTIFGCKTYHAHQNTHIELPSRMVKRRCFDIDSSARHHLAFRV